MHLFPFRIIKLELEESKCENNVMSRFGHLYQGMIPSEWQMKTTFLAGDAQRQLLGYERQTGVQSTQIPFQSLLLVFHILKEHCIAFHGGCSCFTGKPTSVTFAVSAI